MTLDELALRTSAIMNKTKQELVQTREVLPRVYMIPPNELSFGSDLTGDDVLIAVPIPLEMMDSQRSKDRLMTALATTCTEMGGPGFIFVSDVWALEKSPKQIARFFSDASYKKEVIEFCARNGVQKAAASGYGTLVEAITVTGKTVDHFCTLLQNYQRRGSDGIIPPTARPEVEHDIVFKGAPTVIRSDNPDLEDATGERLLPLYKGRTTQ